MTLYRGDRRIKRPIVNGQPARFLMHRGRQVWPCRKPIRPPTLKYRIVEDADEKWFEVGFDSLEELDGSAATGWTDPRGYCDMRLERSENLVTWYEEEFTDCADSGTPNGDGSWKYWARSIFPVDSKVKTGQIWCQSPTADFNSYDTRNNPFTSIKINNVTQSLPNYPYTMPTDAATLQSDLRAAGWTGATVVASSDVNWRIDIPDVPYDAWSSTSKVFWPGYYVADMFGGMTILVDGYGFSGQFVNSVGVRTAVLRQFARMAVRRGPRVLP